MFTDDSRGLESLDRSGASTTLTRVCADGGNPTRSIRRRLEAIDHLTRTLHADIRYRASGELEAVDDDTRRTAARRIREIRASVGQVGLELLGPEASIPYWPPDDPTRGGTIACGDGSFATTYSGPAPEAFEREHQRTDDRCYDNERRVERSHDSECRDDRQERDDDEAREEGGDCDD